MPGHGEITLVAGGPYTSKPRPVLIFQNPEYHTGSSVIVVPFTSADNKVIDTRIAVKPTSANGLDRACFLELDKMSAIDAAYLGKSVGNLEKTTLDKAVRMAIELISPTKGQAIGE
jgi:mRNA-degrading endonuclease toxin of MazEF toxin-antitoxin module